MKLLKNITRPSKHPEVGDNIQVLMPDGMVAVITYNGPEDLDSTSAMPMYSGNNFLEALGDAVVGELLVSDDVRVKVALKMFESVTYSGKLVHVGHPTTQAAFDYLEQCVAVPSFDAPLRAFIEDANNPKAFKDVVDI